MAAPYKAPEKLWPENEIFNNHLSIIRIQSGHAIGFVKGRFQSLKRLRIFIKDEKSHHFATYWVLACIAVHCFAMSCEEEERGDNGDEDPENDLFVAECLRMGEMPEVGGGREGQGGDRESSRSWLQAGKAH